MDVSVAGSYVLLLRYTLSRVYLWYHVSTCVFLWTKFSDPVYILCVHMRLHIHACRPPCIHHWQHTQGSLLEYFVKCIYHREI
jgi:hypothetical protein